MRPLSLLAIAAIASSSFAQNYKGYELDFAPKARINFVEKPGVQEFTGRMIVRPLQADTWKRLGQSKAGAEANRTAAEQRIGDITVAYIEQIDCYVVRVPQGMNENMLANELMKTGLYEYVEPDYRVFMAYTPNDPMLGVQWCQTNNQATEAWDICRGNSAVTVGITDTGIHTSHEDLAATRVLGANSVVATSLANVKTEAVWGISVVQPVHWHGTHCTGSAAAIGGNGKGVTGANIEGTKHLMVRIEDGGGASFTGLTIGAMWAAANGCRVVSTSYSLVDTNVIGTTGTTIKNTYNALWCYAAGNDARTINAVDWPNVTVVGANQSNNTIASFSARGAIIDVMAPGVGIRSTFWTSNAINNQYADSDGTSMATPYAAGVATMILAQNPNYTAQRVEDILYKSCINQGAAGTYGWGRVNLWNAMGRKANTVALVPGILVGGTIADLYRIEGSEYVVKPGVVANQAIPPIQVETTHDVPAYANNNFGEIDLMTKIRITGAAGSFTQKLLIFNNATSQYELVTSGPVNGDFLEGIFPVNAGNFANYIVGGKVKIKTQVYPSGPISGPNYQAAFDQINVRTLRATQ